MINPAIVDRHGKKRVHQEKYTAYINLKENKEAKKALLDQRYLDTLFDQIHFKKINHPNEFMSQTWQDLINF